jgi:hypothetical protein
MRRISTCQAPGAANSLGANKAIVVDGAAPSVTLVTASTADGTYGVGSVIQIEVWFNETLTVTGTPTLALATGSPATTTVAYAFGSGSAILRFNYTIAAGNSSSDLDYTATSALALAGGTITDASGNAAVLTLPAPGGLNSLADSKAIVVDGGAPTVTNVTASNADGIYGVGQIINVQVTFSENVNVSGAPQVYLPTVSPAISAANYSSGSGTNVLTFNYLVTAGNSSADLDYQDSASLVLNGGTIRDAAMNNAMLPLSAPGGAGSLGANKNIIIDGAPPVIVSASTLDLNKNGKIDAYRVTFNEPVLDSSFPGFVVNGLGTVTANWTVAGYTGVRLLHGSQVATLSSGAITDNPNDSVLYLAFAENVLTCDFGSQVGCDTGAKPDLTMSTPGLTDMANNQLAAFGAGAVIETDGAPPKAIAANAIDNTTVEIIFSEVISASTAECGPGSSQSGIACATRYTGDNALTISSVIMSGGVGINGNRVQLTTSAQGWMIAYTLTITPGILQDLAAQSVVAPNNTANFTGVL